MVGCYDVCRWYQLWDDVPHRCALPFSCPEPYSLLCTQKRRTTKDSSDDPQTVVGVWGG